MKLESLLDIAGGAGRRFALGGLLPTVLLLSLLAGLVQAGAPGKRPDLATLAATVSSLDAAEGLLWTASAVVLALLLTPLQIPLVRLLEGYWGDRGLIGWLARYQIRRYRRRRQADEQLVRPRTTPPTDAQTQVQAAARRLLRIYPADPARTMPTLLGNVLRCSEDEAGGRYGMETITFWPRLYPQLPDRLSTLLNDQRDQLDLAARFTAVFALAAVATAGLLLAHGGWWLVLPVVLAVLSWLAYRATVAAALAYGEGLKTAFDLHRFSVRTAMHLPLPPDLKTEREWNSGLSAFLAQGFEVEVTFDHPAD